MGGDAPPEAAEVWVSDLPEGLAEEELWQVFGNYGEVVSIEQVSGGGSETALVAYTEVEAAREASDILNLASMRGKLCRCLRVDVLEVIRQTMDTGQRLIFEHLDPAINSCGLRDLCGLFGQVLDCKVEPGEEVGAHGRGFVHFSSEAEATKAALFIAGVQLGSSAVEIRPFEPADVVLFTGCRYTSRVTRSHAGNDVSAADSDGEDQLRKVSDTPELVPGTPEEMEHAVWQRFRSLKYHHMEVLEDLESKLERLKNLIQLYDPSHAMQVVVVALPSNVRLVAGVLGECLEDCDFESLELSASVEERKAVIEGYETGNLYVVTMSTEVCTRREFDLGVTASVLINFDCPPSLPFHLHRLFKRAGSGTRVHNFFSPTADAALAVPLLKALEEAGHEIPPELLELWSTMDQKVPDCGGGAVR